MSPDELIGRLEVEETLGAAAQTIQTIAATWSSEISKVAPCVEHCRPCVGGVQSSVECIVEVFVKVHLKGVTADISKFIHVDPVVSTQIFLRLKGSEQYEESERLASSTSLHGVEHLRDEFVPLSREGSQQQTVVTKRVTFCDFISTEDVVNLKNSDVNHVSSALQQEQKEINSEISVLKSALKETKLKNDILENRDYKNAVLEDKLKETNLTSKVVIADGNIKEQVPLKPGNNKHVKFGKETPSAAVEDNLTSIENVERKSEILDIKGGSKIFSDPVEEYKNGCSAKLASQCEGKSSCYTPSSTEETLASESDRKLSRQGTDTPSEPRPHCAKMTAEQEVVFTTPLKDYLSTCGLEDLYGYLKMVGCLVVGDLLYLIPSELHALPLLPRRRLCNRLAGLSLTTYLPEKDETLKHALKQQGLGHAYGYVQALGAQTLADLSLLTEEDLGPLPPLTTRRLMILSGRSVEQEKKINCSTDYLM
ncbi:hypothetical protein FHG87_001687 [Trinorchestia longiramus]|nr:hypothetical protein FHG87_001687 [Trinorchestia longiramus]